MVKETLKKLMLVGGAIMLLISLSFGETLPEKPYYRTPQQSIEVEWEVPIWDIGSIRGEIDIGLGGDQWSIDTIKEDIVGGSIGWGSVLVKLIRSFGFDYLDKSPTTAAYYVALVINYFLSILAFIALLVLIYGFARILGAADDKAVEDAKTIMKSALIGILVIGVSWYIVSWIFQIYANTL